jgi:hypothetical protein
MISWCQLETYGQCSQCQIWQDLLPAARAAPEQQNFPQMLSRLGSLIAYVVLEVWTQEVAIL